MKKIHIVITMDCEPTRSPEGATQATSGPLNYEESELSIRAYAEKSAAYGFPVSFFIHPETAIAHPGVFLDLEKSGACLGLHIHPYKIEKTRHRNHFGSLSEWEQAVLIAESSARWASVLGRRPEYFRPGTFSANDSTFGVLARLGFRGGSLSCPGRAYPDLYAVWSGTPPDPHYANPNFRLMEGDLDFVNLPLTVDFSNLETVNDRSFYRDLRPDYMQADYPKIAANIVRQIRERRPSIPMLMVVTHNDHRFDDPDDRVGRNYAVVLESIAQACKEQDIEPVGSTVSEVCELYRSSVELRPPDFVIGHASIQAGQ